MSGWLFWALLSAAFAALTAILAKLGVQDIDPNAATFVRTVVIVAVLAVLLSVFRGWETVATMRPRTIVFLVLSGMATGASWLCYFRALKIGEAARVAPVDKLSVVLVAVFGVLILGERLSMPNWLGVGLITAGALLVAYRG